MGVINDLGTTIDATLLEYTEVVFKGVAGPVTTLLDALALLGLLFIATNQIIQFRSINYSVYLHWGLRWILIYTFATMWVNFRGIYDIFVEVPQDYAALILKAVALNIETLRTDILDPARIKDTHTAMDEFGHSIVWIAHDFLRDTAISDIGKTMRNVFLGALIMIIGGIFLAACAITVLIGKIGFAVAISMAPLALILLMMDQTKHHFDSWTRFTVGFAVIPLLTTALMAVVLFVAGHILAESGASSLQKSRFFGFVFVMIAALVLLFHIPTMASTLASASVAAVGAGAAFALGSMIKNTALKNFYRAHSAGQRLRDAAGVANQARKGGASPGSAAWSAISAMRQSAMLRQERRDRRLAGRIDTDGKGHNVPARRRYQDAPQGGGGGSGSGSGAHQDTAEQQNLNRT